MSGACEGELPPGVRWTALPPDVEANLNAEWLATLGRPRPPAVDATPGNPAIPGLIARGFIVHTRAEPVS